MKNARDNISGPKTERKKKTDRRKIEIDGEGENSVSPSGSMFKQVAENRRVTQSEDALFELLAKAKSSRGAECPSKR